MLIYKAKPCISIFVIRTYSYHMVINSAIVKPFPPPVLEERGDIGAIVSSVFHVYRCSGVLLGGASFKHPS